MPLRYLFKPTFQKAFERLDAQKQRLTVKALEAIDEYFKTGKSTHGLGIKKLYDGSQAKTFEARVTIDLRIVWIQTKEEAVFALLGNHNDVRRFIKNL